VTHCAVSAQDLRRLGAQQEGFSGAEALFSFLRLALSVPCAGRDGGVQQSVPGRRGRPRVMAFSNAWWPSDWQRGPVGLFRKQRRGVGRSDLALTEVSRGCSGDLSASFAARGADKRAPRKRKASGVWPPEACCFEVYWRRALPDCTLCFLGLSGRARARIVDRCVDLQIACFLQALQGRFQLR